MLCTARRPLRKGVSSYQDPPFRHRIPSEKAFLFHLEEDSPQSNEQTGLRNQLGLRRDTRCLGLGPVEHTLLVGVGRRFPQKRGYHSEHKKGSSEVARSGLVEMEARCVSGVFSGVVAINTEEVIGGNSLALGPGREIGYSKAFHSDEWKSFQCQHQTALRLIPAKLDSLPHAHTKALKVNHSTSRLLLLNKNVIGQNAQVHVKFSNSDNHDLLHHQ
ncbi:hypothetical protein Tco_1048007, partial [Tanacetum coccineum]